MFDMFYPSTGNYVLIYMSCLHCWNTVCIYTLFVLFVFYLCPASAYSLAEWPEEVGYTPSCKMQTKDWPTALVSIALCLLCLAP